MSDPSNDWLYLGVVSGEAAAGDPTWEDKPEDFWNWKVITVSDHLMLRISDGRSFMQIFVHRDLLDGDP